MTDPATGPTAEPVTHPTAVSPGARMLAWPIIAYRRWISPALPARCRFYPSCSAYALEAVTTHGAIKGLRLAIWRLLRCHPFNAGGYDPVPPSRAH
jgi:putative membrane protein insertion efficiency factor